MKRKRIVPTAVLVLLQLCNSLWALTTTVYEAEMVVTGWLKANPQPLDTTLSLQVIRVETFTDDFGEPVYYIVYLQPSGFVIVSADDRVEPIIGFADDGTYDLILENPLGALVTNDLNRRIAAVRSTFSPLAIIPQMSVTETQKKWSYFIGLAEPTNSGFKLMSEPPICNDNPSDVRVGPLVKSSWGQSWYFGLGDKPQAYYNYYTPRSVWDDVNEVYGPIIWKEGEPSNYPCGCVATAMAQLMRYHRHPNEPVEPNEFTISVNRQTTERWLLRGEGLDGAYNWSDMVLESDCDTTDEQRRAIGALCHDAGISVGTEYTAYGSGALLSDAAKALVDTFQYENAVWAENDGNDINYQDLIEMINTNLDANLPVILGINYISEPNIGHAVICDGYGYDSSTPYHHLNMGWYGYDDCWYNLPNIDYAGEGGFDSITKCIYNIFTDGTGEIISGRILSTKDRPISDAVVTAQSGEGLDAYTAVTNSKGIYALKGVDPNSSYNVTVNRLGYDFVLNEVDTGTSSDGNSVSGNKWGVNFMGYSNSITVTIGDETSDWDYPAHTSYHDSRTQVIYLASEIGISGTITEMALDVTEAPEQTLENWTIRMKHTSISEYDTCSLDANGWTVVYQNNEEFDTDWHSFEFQRPFEYNGTDNLLVDFSHNNNSYTENGLCRVSRPGGSRSVYACSDSRDGDPLDWSGATSPEVYRSNNIPNVKLTFCRDSKVVSPDIKLIASDGETNDYFGHSVSISGDYAIVGAYGHEDNRGAAYIFNRESTNWTQHAKLTASDGDFSDQFGYSVSISGDYAIVGAPENDAVDRDSGAAYVFKRDGTSWVQQAKLTASYVYRNTVFGCSVSISGDYAIVGARSDREKGHASGAAYIFKRNGTTWTQQAKLNALDSATYDYFGNSVSISGDYVIVCRGFYYKGSDSGSAYIFKREDTGWTQQDKLITPDGTSYDRFGYSASISGDYAIAGAPEDNDNGINSGSAFIFKLEGTSWTGQAKLTALDGAPADYFGKSASISGDYTIIGAPNVDDDNKGRDCGSAYVFKREGTEWTQQAKLMALDGAYDDLLGSSVSIDGDYAIVGAPNDDDNGSKSGSAYIFKWNSTTWTP